MSEPISIEQQIDILITQVGKLVKVIERSMGHEGYYYTASTTGIYHSHGSLVVLDDTTEIEKWTSGSGEDLIALFGLAGVVMDTKWPAIHIPKGLGGGSYIKMVSGKVGLAPNR